MPVQTRTPTDDDEVITRRSRVDDLRDARAADDDHADKPGTTDLSPEDAAEASKRALEERDADLAEERQARQKAERDKVEALRIAGEHAAGRVADRERAIAGELDAATTAKQGAIAKYRTAREAGDLDAEVAAQTELADATARVNDATRAKTSFDAEKERLKASPNARRQRAAEDDGGEEYSPAAKAWIAKHPRFNSDSQYKAIAIGAHTAAIADGMQEGSRAYFRFLDETIGRVYGDEDVERGGRRSEEDQDMPQDRPSPNGRRSATSTAAPRGGDASGRRLSANGAVRLSAEEREAAKICGMSEAEYAADLVAIEAEKRAGKPTGLVYGAGATYQ